MYTFLVILHVIVSLFLILVVLLQTGRGAQMGASFGGGGQAMFGARGQTTFIQKLTAGMAIVFMVLSVALASLSARTRSNLADTPTKGKEAGMAKEEKPATPPLGESPAPAAAPTDAAQPSAAQPAASASVPSPEGAAKPAAADTKAPAGGAATAAPAPAPAPAKPAEKPAKP